MSSAALPGNVQYTIKLAFNVGGLLTCGVLGYDAFGIGGAIVGGVGGLVAGNVAGNALTPS